jgi:hypothetical protein
MYYRQALELQCYQEVAGEQGFLFSEPVANNLNAFTEAFGTKI